VRCGLVRCYAHGERLPNDMLRAPDKLNRAELSRTQRYRDGDRSNEAKPTCVIVQILDATSGRCPNSVVLPSSIGETTPFYLSAPSRPWSSLVYHRNQDQNRFPPHSAGWGSTSDVDSYYTHHSLAYRPTQAHLHISRSFAARH